MELLINLLLYIIGMFILYLVIQAAVRNGIDSSEVGKMLRGEQDINEDKKVKKSFLDDDLDKDY